MTTQQQWEFGAFNEWLDRIPNTAGHEASVNRDAAVVVDANLDAAIRICQDRFRNADPDPMEVIAIFRAINDEAQKVRRLEWERERIHLLDEIQNSVPVRE